MKRSKPARWVLEAKVAQAKAAHSKAASARDRAITRADSAWKALVEAESNLALHDLLNKPAPWPARAQQKARRQ